MAVVTGIAESLLWVAQGATVVQNSNPDTIQKHMEML